jgi:glycosyltransferase involved in cell wall biosynthesis
VTRRLLVVEPYYGGSHRAFLDGLLARLPWDADLLTLPARKWKWRMSGAAVTMAGRAEDLYERGARWDVLLASTFVNLPELLGLARRALAGVRTLVYFHENQLEYPNRYEEEWDFQYPLTNVKSALAADACAFNSRYNLDSMLDTLPAFLKRFPDNVPSPPAVAGAIASRSVVLPPPFDPAAVDAAPLVRGEAPRVVWPHRWDHDKDPAAFAAAMMALAAEGIPFEVAVAGQAHEDSRGAFDALAHALAGRVVVLGGLESREAYAEVLRSSDVSVSTAQHEFFGLAMAESAYAGCFPLVPDRLAYPELYPPECRYRTQDELVARLRALLTDARPAPDLMRPSAARFTFDRLAPLYERLLEDVASARLDPAAYSVT